MSVRSFRGMRTAGVAAARFTSLLQSVCISIFCPTARSRCGPAQALRLVRKNIATTCVAAPALCFRFGVEVTASPSDLDCIGLSPIVRVTMRPFKSRSLGTFSGPHRATDTAQAIILLQKLLACIDTHWEAIVARYTNIAPLLQLASLSASCMQCLHDLAHCN